MIFLDFLIFYKICLSDDIQGLRVNSSLTNLKLNGICQTHVVVSSMYAMEQLPSRDSSSSHSFVCCHGKENIFPPKCGECPAFRSSTLYCKINLVCFLDHKSQTLTSSDGTGRYIQYYMLLRICLNIRSQFNFIFEIRAIYKKTRREAL